jgi:AcrR family transcriptional regulator
MESGGFAMSTRITEGSIIRQVSNPVSNARRTNRRGQATRDSMLDAALRALATGDAAAASANRIAKDAGATWGAVKYQFGDIDGLWAAVLRRTAERRGQLTPSLFAQPLIGKSQATHEAPLRERVATIIDLLFDGLTAPDSRAIETLRTALPRDGAELDRLYPQTAAELQSWGRSWIDACQRAFAGVDVDPARVREVASFIPGAMRGLASERQLGSYYDLDLARRGLTNAIVAYLEPPRRQPTPAALPQRMPQVNVIPTL